MVSPTFTRRYRVPEYGYEENRSEHYCGAWQEQMRILHGKNLGDPAAVAGGRNVRVSDYRDSRRSRKFREPTQSFRASNRIGQRRFRSHHDNYRPIVRGLGTIRASFNREHPRSTRETHRSPLDIFFRRERRIERQGHDHEASKALLFCTDRSDVPRIRRGRHATRRPPDGADDPGAKKRSESEYARHGQWHARHGHGPRHARNENGAARG